LRPRILQAGMMSVFACALMLALPAFAADPDKVIRHVFPAAETGFDPAGAQDLYSGTIEQAIFETLLTYDYLARPAKIVPLVAETLPRSTDTGGTDTSKIRKCIQFTTDPALKSQTRWVRARE